jgi:HK97 family phage major capsid protein/HK97 family phage prohead protease
MADHKELPRMKRELRNCTLEVRKGADGRTRLKLSASSEYPVDRWGMTEILSHDPGAVRLDRAKGGNMPILFNHNWDDPVGMVNGATVADGRLQLEGGLFDTDRAADIAKMIDGGLHNVSIGYQIHEITENRDNDTYTATDWEPYEVSIVTVPADPTVGVGRDAAGIKFPVRVKAMPDTTVTTDDNDESNDDGEDVVGDDPDAGSIAAALPPDPVDSVAPMLTGDEGDNGDDEDSGDDVTPELDENSQPRSKDDDDDEDEDRDKNEPDDDGDGDSEDDDDDDKEEKSASKISIPAASAKTLKEHSMSDVKKPAGGANPESQSALSMEADRKRAIENLCKANQIQDSIRDLWITSGRSVDKVSDELLTIMEERGKKNPSSGLGSLGLSPQEANRFSITKAIRAVADKTWQAAGFEAECSREIGARLNRAPDPNKFYVPLEVQQRSIDGRSIAARDAMRGVRTPETVGTANQGGYLVATINQSFIEVLRNRAVAYRMGARTLSGLVGNVTVPRQTAAGSAYWLASESTQLTPTNQAFGQMALTPKNVGAYTEISRLLLLQSSPDAEGIINADLAAITALAVDEGVLNGPGTSGQPTGIVNTTGVGNLTDSSITTMNYAGCLEFQSTVAAANVIPTSGGYVTTPQQAKNLMTRVKFTNTATPLWDGNLWDAVCCGYPAMNSNQLSYSAGNSQMIFGDWSQVIVGEWGVLEIEVNPYANFQAGIIGVRALMTLDVGLRYPQAFVQTSVAA